MTDKGWGCVFAAGIFAVVSVALYGVTFFVLSLIDVGDNHRVAISSLIGLSGALALHKILD